MTLHSVEQTESELERLRIELAIIRAAKIRDDLTRLVNEDPLGSLKINDIGRIHENLRDLEVDARELVHELPPAEYVDEINIQNIEPFLLLNPLPEARLYSIESVTDKFHNT